MKIAILGTKGIPNNYGGFEQFAEFLSSELFRQGHSVTVYSPHFHSFKEQIYKNINIRKIFHSEKLIGPAANIFYDYFCLKDALKKGFDIILECGYGSASFAYCLTDISGTFVITNMDGIEWQRSKWSWLTKKVLKFSEYLAVKKSHIIISDNICIREYYKKKYNIDSEYIPYGAEIIKTIDDKYPGDFSLPLFEYFVILARMEPENNIGMILDGYINSGMNNKFAVISNTNSRYARYIIKRYKKYSNIIFLGNNYDQKILTGIRHYSKAYFHGHSAGGTNPSLLEAMASGSLIIAHDNIYNRAVLGTDAYYFLTTGDISDIIKKLVDLQLEKNSFISNNIVKIENDYSWTNVADQYIGLFQKLIESGK